MLNLYINQFYSSRTRSYCTAMLNTNLRLKKKMIFQFISETLYLLWIISKYVQFHWPVVIVENEVESEIKKSPWISWLIGVVCPLHWTTLIPTYPHSAVHTPLKMDILQFFICIHICHLICIDNCIFGSKHQLQFLGS